MGVKESKQSCISYEDAIKRVSEAEFQRIKNAFKKSAGVERIHLSQKSFYHDVLCQSVPLNIAHLLFAAFGGSTKGISFRDLLCGLVLLTRGTEEEKIRFLWNLYIYCNDVDTHILKSEFARATDACPDENIDLFIQSDRVNFDQFREWIKQNANSMILSKWLLTDPSLSLTREFETPTFYQSLAGVTHLDEKDIGDLEKEFWQIKNSSSTNQLDLQVLGILVSPPIPKNALVGFFNAFDENRDSHIDFKELCCGVSAACRGPVVERTRFCFKIFDIDRDGLLSHNETIHMIHVLLFVAKENFNSVQYNNLSNDEVINDLLKFAKLKEAESNMNFTAENICLTAEYFMMWSVESDLKLVQPFLDLVFEVCHIIFGLWPQCRHLEYSIVKSWLIREERRRYRVGQFWYLISRDWWMNWLHYVQGTDIICDYCKKSINLKNYNTGDVDEALVCDESFNSSSLDHIGDAVDSYSLGSTSSGFSSGRSSYIKPGPIDNSNLINISPFKNVRTLTGEGGQLKRNTPLVQSHDFELVPKSLWKALNRWYGDNLPLPRQVIQPPDQADVELELYPLTLRILVHHNNNLSLSSWSSASGEYRQISSGVGYMALSPPGIIQPPKRYLAYVAAFSRLATIRQIAGFLGGQLRLKFEDIRLWHIPAGPVENNGILLEEENLTLQDLYIQDNDQILLEIRNKDLTWPEELRALVLPHQNTHSDENLTWSRIQSVHPQGATGLHNLGNTCFMNSALQVLFNTQPLAKYFLKGLHLYELNTNNKLGTKGQLAIRYGELLKEIWNSKTRSVAPLKLRICVNKHAPQFAGGGQHDSQELLEWLLDALHEDLNRVTVKPYKELKDSNGRPDEEVAAEAWSQHHARNQSVITDLFYGQLKSKVNCLCCGNESVRFDPFSLLSLPLPVESFTYFEVLVIVLDGSVPIKYGLRLNSESTYMDLKVALSPLCSLNPKLMLVCEVYNSQIREFLQENEKIKTSTAKDLYVYQLAEECRKGSHTSSIMKLNNNGLEEIQRNLDEDSAKILCNDTSQETIRTDVENNNSTRIPSSRLQHNQQNDENEDIAYNEASSKPTEPNTIMDMQLLSPGSGMYNSLHSDHPGRNAAAYPQIAEGKRNSCAHYKTQNRIESRALSTIRDDNGSIVKEVTRYNYSANAGKYFIALHRKITRQDNYFLSHHKSQPSLFGVPLLVQNCKNGTQKDLYCAVWVQVRRLLSPLPTTKDQSNHAADCDDSLGYNYPFTLRAVKRDGLNCAFCHWSSFCRGCKIQCNNEFFLEDDEQIERANLSSLNEQSSVDCIMNVTVAIDWDPTALHLRYQSSLERLWIDHKTLEICREKETEPIDLNHCLQEFTSEEDLEQWYHCSYCKGNKPATKKLQIWKLPPILIFHLKRFNCVNGKWMKSQKVVHFPFDNFDPTPYLASSSQEAILRREQITVDQEKVSAYSSKREDISSVDILKKIGQDSDEKSEPENMQMGTFDLSNNTPIQIQDISDISNAFDTKLLEENKRNTSLKSEGRDEGTMQSISLYSHNLTQSDNILDSNPQCFHKHKLESPNDYLDLKYKLYAVVSHSGMLNGGHYIAYAANSNGSWYCYNDSSCRETSNPPNIDPSSAYLLFYERKGLNYESYLPNIGERTILPPELILDADDGENDLKKLCLIS